MGTRSDARTGQLFNRGGVRRIADELRFAGCRAGEGWRELNRNWEAVSSLNRNRQIQPEENKFRTGRLSEEMVTAAFEAVSVASNWTLDPTVTLPKLRVAGVIPSWGLAVTTPLP